MRGIFKTARLRGVSLGWKDFLVAVAISLSLFFLGTLAALSLFKGEANLEEASVDLGAVAVSGISAQLLSLLGFAFFRRKASVAGEPRGFSPLHSIGIGLGVWMAVMLSSIVIGLPWKMLLQVFGYEGQLQSEILMLAQTDAGWQWVLMVLLAGLIAPVCEELFFRGMLYRFFSSRTGPYLAAAIVGILFSLAHFSALAAPVLFVLGTVNCIVYRATGSIVAPIATHAAFNSVSLILVAIGGAALK